MRIKGWAAALGVLGIALACADVRRQDRRIGLDDGRRTRQCADFLGILVDTTPGGREVHAAPDAGSPVLGRIAEPLTVRDGGIWKEEVSFVIKGSQGGWLLVEGAGDDPEHTGGVQRSMYEGAGWIRGTGVVVAIQASQGFAEPRHSSDIVLQAADPLGLDAGLTGIAACEGEWVLGRWEITGSTRLRYRSEAVVSRSPLVVEAWATGICNNPDTTCDMPSGDRPDSLAPDP
jgi:hypothetical protein